MKMKRLCGRALSVAVGAAVLVQAQAPVLASAVETREYISEVFLSYGETDEQAKDWLEKNGYTVLGQNLNEGAEGGVSWLGLSSGKRSVYLGYKTTENSDEAITDMRVMNMNGDFSYEAYEKMVNDRKNEINAFINSLIAALKEYRTNYEAKKPKAVIAHDNLNKYYDDDSSDAYMGDLLLRPIKEEMTEEEYGKAPAEHADMTTVMLQGNLDIVRDIMSNLAYAADTSDTTWLQRLEKADTADVLYDRYEKEYPELSESKIDSLMISEYDEDARIFTDCINEIRSAVKIVDEVELPKDADSETAEKYFEEHPDQSDMAWTSAVLIVSAVQDVELNGKPLLDLAKDEDADYSTAENRTVLYPLIDALSEGQRGLLAYTDFRNMILSGSYGDDEWKTLLEENKKNNETTYVNSVYAGVIRSAFQPGGVALTNEARNFKNSTGTSFNDGLFGVGIDWVPIAGMTTGLLTLAGGLVAKHIGKGTHIETVYVDAQKRLTELHKTIEAPNKKLFELFEAKRQVMIKQNTSGIPGYDIEFKMKDSLSIFNPKELSKQSDTTFDFIEASLLSDDEYNKAIKGFNEGYSKIKKEWNEIMTQVNQNVEDHVVTESMKYKTWVKKSVEVENKGARVLGNVLCAAGVLISLGSCVGSAAIGALICFLIVRLRRRDTAA